MKKTPLLLLCIYGLLALPVSMAYSQTKKTPTDVYLFDTLLIQPGQFFTPDSTFVQSMELLLQTKKKKKKPSAAQAASILFNLYLCYGLGWGVPVDTGRALEYCHQSAELGNPLAQNDLGKIYEDGEDRPRNDSLAMHYYQLAADQDLGIAWYNLGRMLFHGTEQISEDQPRALFCWQRAAEKGIIQACTDLGAFYLSVSEYEIALPYVRQAAEQGCAISAFNLSQLYLEGNGVPADSLQAVYWAALSADKGYEAACLMMGRYYFLGEGVGVDYSKAVLYFRPSAEKGNSSSQYLLAVSLQLSNQCEEAVKWFLLSAEDGVKLSQSALSQGYLYGNCGFEKDLDKALYWGVRAAEQGEDWAEFYVGLYFSESREDSVRHKGLFFLQGSAEKGNWEAAHSLGHYYVRQTDQDSLVQLGVNYLIRAAELGSMKARVELGQLYAGGFGCPPSGWEESLENLLPGARENNFQKIHSVAGHYCALLDFENAKKWLLRLDYRSPRMEQLLRCLP